MLNNFKIAVVIPAYNVEKLIISVINSVPQFVDSVIVINDCSQDGTLGLIEGYKTKYNLEKLIILSHKENQGVGGAIASGYKWCRDNNVDCAVVMAGDGQMDPSDMEKLIKPIIDGECDYVKGNRLITGESWNKIPKIRYVGIASLSFLTKIASGYWSISDSQCGYTVVNKKILKIINWDLMYKRYGQPNDLLVSLNIHNFSVKDVPVRPIYNVGERSGIKIPKVIFSISWLLFKLFWRRMIQKYMIRDFHPLVFFYSLGFIILLIDIPLFVRLFVYFLATGIVLKINLLLSIFFTITMLMCFFIAMYMDMEYNKYLSRSFWMNKF